MTDEELKKLSNMLFPALTEWLNEKLKPLLEEVIDAKLAPIKTTLADHTDMLTIIEAKLNIAARHSTRQ